MLFLCVFGYIGTIQSNEAIDNSSLSIEEIMLKLRENAKTPIHIKGSFRFMRQNNINENSPLVLKKSGEITGYIDTYTGKCRLYLKNFVERVGTGEGSYRRSDMHITFDGAKWLVTTYPYDTSGLPDGIKSTSEVTESVPPIFLETKDLLFFPLIPLLNIIQTDKEKLTLEKALSSPEKYGLTISINRSEKNDILLKISSECISDTFTFSSDSNMFLMKRTTDYNGCATSDESRKIFRYYETNGKVGNKGFFLPENAILKQIVNDNIRVIHEFEISSVTTEENIDFHCCPK